MSRLFEVIHPANITWRNQVPVSSVFDDVYFSLENGLEETQHVFIQGNQLISRWQQLPPYSMFVIAETGFGTGLNFLATWACWLQYAPSTANLFYYTTELHPLTRADLVKCLSLWPQLAPLSDALIAAYPLLTPGYHYLTFAEGRITLILMLGDATAAYQQLLESADIQQEALLRPWHVDAWFLDGFAPAKNESMWQAALFRTMALLSKAGTTVATFTAASAVRSGLSACGFEVRKQKGFGRKRDMICARFTQACEAHFLRCGRMTPWHVVPVRSIQEKHALIVGGGLAGCFSAYALAKRGFQVTILEKNDRIASEASGNQHGVLYPKLSAFQSPFTSFMLSAFVYAAQFYQTLLQNKSIEGELLGILQFAANQREKTTQSYLQNWLAAYPELGEFVSADRASQLAGVPITEPALWIPKAGWINSRVLCHYLIQQPGISVQYGRSVDALMYADGLWHAGGLAAETLIIANASNAQQFVQLADLPIKTIQGSLTFLQTHAKTQGLKVPLCAEGHLLPAKAGQHVVGATYHMNLQSRIDITSDNQSNWHKAKNMPIAEMPDLTILEQWSGLRATTPDYMPLVGPVVCSEAFQLNYQKLKKNAKYYIKQNATPLSGLYICAAFGSRGLTSIPLSAEYLASMINQEPSALPRDMRQALASARFLLKDLIKNVKK